MRNFVYHVLLREPSRAGEFDVMYGESQCFIGEAILVSNNVELKDEINKLNERMFHADWQGLSAKGNNFDQADEIMEGIKKDAIGIIERMRHDIEESTRFERADLVHIFGGIFSRKKRAK